MESDAELLRRYAREESQEAFAELARRHLSLVFSAGMRRTGGNQALAEEITQQVFLRLAGRAGELSRHAVLAGWLYTTTRNAAINLVRAENRRRERERKAGTMDISENSSGREDWSRIQPVLDDLMDRLSDRERAALILRFFEGRAYAEIGRELSITEDAARMRVERALEKLRAALGRKGIGSTAAVLAVTLAEHTALAAPAGLATSVAQAGAAAAVGAGCGWWPFMSTIKTTIGTAGLLGLAALIGLPAAGIALRQFNAWQRTRTEWARQEMAYGTKRQTLQDVTDAAQAASRAQLLLQKQIDDARHGRSGSGAPGAGGTGQPAARNPKADGQKFLAAYPQARAMLAAGIKTQIDGVYASFFHNAGLTPGQIAQFDDIWTQSWLKNITVTPGGLPGGFSYIASLPADQLSQFLDAQQVQQYQDYIRKIPAYILAGGINAAVGLVAAPLSPTQMDQLSEIVANSSSVYRSGGVIAAPAGASVDWNAVGSAARTVVSSAQWPAVESGLVQAQYQEAIAAAMHGAGAGASAP